MQVRAATGRKRASNHEVAMTIDTDYDEFVGSIDKKLELSNKVGIILPLSLCLYTTSMARAGGLRPAKHTRVLA